MLNVECEALNVDWIVGSEELVMGSGEWRVRAGSGWWGVMIGEQGVGV